MIDVWTYGLMIEELEHAVKRKYLMVNIKRNLLECHSPQ